MAADTLNSQPADKNRRVLVINDNRAIHDDFCKILSPAAATEAAVFGDSNDVVPQTQFEVDSAYQGQEGLALVEKARQAGRP